MTSQHGGGIAPNAPQAVILDETLPGGQTTYIFGPFTWRVARFARLILKLIALNGATSLSWGVAYTFDGGVTYDTTFTIGTGITTGTNWNVLNGIPGATVNQRLNNPFYVFVTTTHTTDTTHFQIILDALTFL